MATRTIKRLDDLTDHYDLILCDVWGVIHNGVAAWTQAYRALMRARQAGLQVVAITNAPRPFKQVVEQLDGLGVPRETFDAVVTSGDVTRALISQNSKQVYHLGQDKDLPIYEGLDVQLVAEAEAQVIVCTGLEDDNTQTPEDYAELLSRFAARDLPFICANPDIVVEMGERLLWCAGALARDYAALGGTTMIAGKPHAPIYDEAIRQAEVLSGKKVDRRRVLAIGDGMPTDVKGARDNGVDLLFISDGIHAREYGEPGNPNAEMLDAFLKAHNAAPTATMVKLA
ncbi:MAG: TIGR01459 family HAD-type hydrolase [Ahrensia sp.]|nr:TIGR01459 family HAD-type hydrolase [Ahrensia sp.]